MREAHELIARYAPRHEVPLALSDVPVLVRTNSPALASALTGYFAAWDTRRVGGWQRLVYAIQGEHAIDARSLVVVPRERGKEPKEAYREDVGGRIVYKLRTGVGYYVMPGQVVIAGDLERETSQVVNLIGNLVAQSFLERGFVMVHASAVAAHHGVAFAGASGAGKSTMALAMLDRGYRFVSNDRVLLRGWGDRVEMAGLPKMPRVNPGTIMRLERLRPLIGDTSRYDRMDAEALWALEEKRDVRIPDVFGSDPLPRAGLDVVYVLAWTRSGRTPKVRPIEGIELAQRLREVMRSAGLFDLRPEPRTAWYQALAMAASRLRGFEVSGGIDVEWLADMVKGAPASA